MQLLCVRRVSRTPCNLSFKRRHIHQCRSKMSISTASCWTACILASSSNVWSNYFPRNTDTLCNHPPTLFSILLCSSSCRTKLLLFKKKNPHPLSGFLFPFDASSSNPTPSPKKAQTAIRGKHVGLIRRFPYISFHKITTDQ